MPNLLLTSCFADASVCYPSNTLTSFVRARGTPHLSVGVDLFPGHVVRLLRGQLRGHEVPRTLRRRVGFHASLLHRRAHRVQRLGAHTSALPVHVPAHLHGRARRVVVVFTPGGGSQVVRGVSVADVLRSPPRKGEIVHVVGVVGGDVKHLRSNRDRGVNLRGHRAAEAGSEPLGLVRGGAGGVDPVYLVRLTHLDVFAVLKGVLAEAAGVLFLDVTR